MEGCWRVFEAVGACKQPGTHIRTYIHTDAVCPGEGLFFPFEGLLKAFLEAFRGFRRLLEAFGGFWRSFGGL